MAGIAACAALVVVAVLVTGIVLAARHPAVKAVVKAAAQNNAIAPVAPANVQVTASAQAQAVTSPPPTASQGGPCSLPFNSLPTFSTCEVPKEGTGKMLQVNATEEQKNWCWQGNFTVYYWDFTGRHLRDPAAPLPTNVLAMEFIPILQPGQTSEFLVYGNGDSNCNVPSSIN